MGGVVPRECVMGCHSIVHTLIDIINDAPITGGSPEPDLYIMVDSSSTPWVSI